jgi:hypothetical protein
LSSGTRLAVVARMNPIRISITLAAPILLAACGDRDASFATREQASTAYFYQYVAPSDNAVRSGITSDGRAVASYGVDVLAWQHSKAAEKLSYGDPVFSRLANGRWTMTARSANEDPRGAQWLLIHEADCPAVDHSKVVAIGPASGPGCQPVPSLIGGKSSQVFSAPGGDYVFLMQGGSIFLVHLSDGSSRTTQLANVCLRSSKATSLAELAVGQGTLVFEKESGGLLLSDTAIARRPDGTWTLFAKGIPKSSGCQPGGGLCELCNRGVYRSTSPDLISWSPLQKIVDKASIPEATVGADGKVWLYWQNFAPACAAQNLQLAARAPITGAYENDDGSLSAPSNVSFSDEKFESDGTLHYATNGNPIRLPDAAAKRALDACFGR